MEFLKSFVQAVSGALKVVGSVGSLNCADFELINSSYEFLKTSTFLDWIIDSDHHEVNEAWETISFSVSCLFVWLTWRGHLRRVGGYEMTWQICYIYHLLSLELFSCHGVGEAWGLIWRDKQTSRCWRTRRPNSYFRIPCDRKVTQSGLHHLRRLTKVCADRVHVCLENIWPWFWRIQKVVGVLEVKESFLCRVSGFSLIPGSYYITV